MIFTWDWKNTCVVFRWWHIKTYFGFVLSMFAVVLLGMGYEYVRAFFANWEREHASTVVQPGQDRRFKLRRGILYGFQVWYSFMLMLVFMTYNGWLMIAVAVGAAIGNYIWGSSSQQESVRIMACHWKSMLRETIVSFRKFITSK